MFKNLKTENPEIITCEKKTIYLWNMNLRNIKTKKVLLVVEDNWVSFI